MKLPIPDRMYTPAIRTARAASAAEAAGWLTTAGGTGILQVYEGPSDLLPSGYSVGIRKPGKYASDERALPVPYDMLPIVWTGSTTRGFDAGFNDICRSLWNLGQASQQQRTEDAARLLGALLYRDACFVDHAENDAGDWRYHPPIEAMNVISSLQETRIETLTATHDLPPGVFLSLLEIIALIEDTKYWDRAGRKVSGRTGRPNTLSTCARALACGLGYEHPMDFAYALMRGTGVASLTRDRAVSYFG